MPREFVGATKLDRYGRVSILSESAKALGVKKGEMLQVWLDRGKKEIVIKRAEEK